MPLAKPPLCLLDLWKEQYRRPSDYAFGGTEKGETS